MLELQADVELPAQLRLPVRPHLARVGLRQRRDPERQREAHLAELLVGQHKFCAGRTLWHAGPRARQADGTSHSSACRISPLRKETRARTEGAVQSSEG